MKHVFCESSLILCTKFCTLNDGFLKFFGKIYEVFTVSSDTDDKIFILFGIFLGSFHLLCRKNRNLCLHAALLEIGF